MRKALLVAAATAAAMLATLFAWTSSASADGNTVVNLGPGTYTTDFSHPTGTLTLGGGTTSARCSSSAFVGNATNHTPKCATRVITCPVTASYCTLVVNAQENALRGPVAFGAALNLVGPAVFVSVDKAYNCPQAYSCGTKVTFLLGPGTTAQGGIQSFGTPGWPVTFIQLTSTAH
jgi:hypothetical protein